MGTCASSSCPAGRRPSGQAGCSPDWAGAAPGAICNRVCGTTHAFWQPQTPGQALSCRTLAPSLSRQRGRAALWLTVPNRHAGLICRPALLSSTTTPHFTSIAGPSSRPAPPDSPTHLLRLRTMSGDGLALLAQRLQALQDDGVKLNPATANPGELLGRGAPPPPPPPPPRAGGAPLACQPRL